MNMIPCIFTCYSRGPTLAVVCEYDALPEIGHACGHNLIAEAGVGAALGIQAAFKQAGKALGKVRCCDVYIFWLG